jgi:hypothetical protein
MAFAISSVVAVAGLGLTAASMYMSYENQQNAADAQAAGAAKQAQIAQLQAQNVDVQKQQLDLQSEQQKLQINTQKGVIQSQAEADALRMQAATLDATRKRREQVRQGIVAMSQNLVAATAGGAAQPGSSALGQVQANVSGQQGTNILGITQNLDFANKLFNINKDITSQYLAAQDANSAYVDKSKALQTQVLETQKQIYSLGGDANQSFAQAAEYSGNASMWGGLANLGQTLTANSSTIGKISSSFGNAFSSSSVPFYAPDDI